MTERIRDWRSGSLVGGGWDSWGEGTAGVGVESGPLAPEFHCSEVLLGRVRGRPACAGGAGPMKGAGKEAPHPTTRHCRP